MEIPFASPAASPTITRTFRQRAQCRSRSSSVAPCTRIRTSVVRKGTDKSGRNTQVVSSRTSERTGNFAPKPRRRGQCVFRRFLVIHSRSPTSSLVLGPPTSSPRWPVLRSSLAVGPTIGKRSFCPEACRPRPAMAVLSDPWRVRDRSAGGSLRDGATDETSGTGTAVGADHHQVRFNVGGQLRHRVQTDLPFCGCLREPDRWLPVARAFSKKLCDSAPLPVSRSHVRIVCGAPVYDVGVSQRGGGLVGVGQYPWFMKGPGSPGPGGAGQAP